ncbi:hypothetical protein BU23DRAFT_557623 [Bimuria novae-zelandiae CBS 107.79]|uniref:Uncharacterized protein n=1 Tax=Bimuria novae-zelandiae CBS 107.79 TaxID=1447943 RepID=A0A6A5UZQ7_9PLEO|nr:hypothetical protein BU23DRAFT_557623 [Bimuria novae-zelandiae CBS 107.79]
MACTIRSSGCTPVKIERGISSHSMQDINDRRSAATASYSQRPEGWRSNLIICKEAHPLFENDEKIHMPKDDSVCRLDSLHSVLSMPDCDDVPVRLLHLSFWEFLTDTSKKEKSPFWVDERARHERLAPRCLELMSGPDGLRQNMCEFSIIVRSNQ